MALLTLGTNATTTLQALNWNAQSAAADIAAINNNIKSQPRAGTFQVLSPGAFTQGGRLHFPGRIGSFILLRPGDYVAYDAVGWPIVVSAYSIANSGGWTHS
jgi:hypothetical protein